MECNGGKLLFIVCVLQSLARISLTKADQVGSCFSSYYTRATGHTLRGFIIVEMEVDTVIECKRRCVYTANCLSLNILTNADGSIVCQLNSGLKENAAREQFVPHGAGEYYSLKEKKLCENNGKTCDNATPWHAFNQSYFRFFASKLDFNQALEFCREHENGDLASISSEEEQTFLHKTFLETNPDVSSACWTGLNDLTKEGVFVWSDGSPFTYARFKAGHPDNYLGKQDCVLIYKNGYLNDFMCETKLPFICETSHTSLYG